MSWEHSEAPPNETDSLFVGLDPPEDPLYGPSSLWAPRSREQPFSQETDPMTVRFNVLRVHTVGRPETRWTLEEQNGPLTCKGPLDPGHYKMRPAYQTLDPSDFSEGEFRLIEQIIRLGVAVIGPSHTWGAESPDLIPGLRGGMWDLNWKLMNGMDWIYE